MLEIPVITGLSVEHFEMKQEQNIVIYYADLDDVVTVEMSTILFIPGRNYRLDILVVQQCGLFYWLFIVLSLLFCFNCGLLKKNSLIRVYFSSLLLLIWIICWLNNQCAMFLVSSVILFNIWLTSNMYLRTKMSCV